MAQRLKAPSRTAEAIGRDERKLRETVEGIIDDVRSRGDAAVREWSIKLDRWDRDGYRLGEDEIRACIETLSPLALEDLRFAQAQVRNFAQIQRRQACLRDVEVETLPGVVLGHIATSRSTCVRVLCARGQAIPLLASAHMSVIDGEGCRCKVG